MSLNRRVLLLLNLSPRYASLRPSKRRDRGAQEERLHNDTRLDATGSKPEGCRLAAWRASEDDTQGLEARECPEGRVAAPRLGTRPL